MLDAVTSRLVTISFLLYLTQILLPITHSSSLVLLLRLIAPCSFAKTDEPKDLVDEEQDSLTEQNEGPVTDYGATVTHWMRHRQPKYKGLYNGEVERPSPSYLVDVSKPSLSQQKPRPDLSYLILIKPLIDATTSRAKVCR